MRQFHELAQLCPQQVEGHLLRKDGFHRTILTPISLPCFISNQSECHLAFPLLCACNPPSITIYFKNPFDLSVWFGVVVFHWFSRFSSCSAKIYTKPKMRCQKTKSSFLFQILWQLLIQVNSEFLCGDLPGPEDPLFSFTSLSSILTVQA